MNKSNKNQPLDHYCNAPCEILNFIALEESALSNILNAEGEKIQKADAMKDISIEDLLCVKLSVAKTIREVTSLELVLLSKLEADCSNSCHPTPPLIHNDELICFYVYNCKTHEDIYSAKINICKNIEIISEGYTDDNGKYVINLLPFGCYIAKIENKNLEHQIFEVDNKKHCYNDLKVCFDITNCPPTVKPRNICIRGQVTDKCGTPLANVRVLAKGENTLIDHTDHCGFYEICNLQITDCFSVTSKYSCCTGSSCKFNNVTKNCFNINLIILCQCCGGDEKWKC